MQITAAQIGQLINATIEGDPEAVISGFSKIEEAEEMSLCFIANPKYTPYLYNTKAAAIIISKDLVFEQTVANTLLRVDDAYAAFAKLMQFYETLTGGGKKKGVENMAFVDENAKVDETAYIGSFSYISTGAVIGKNVQIFPNVFIGANVNIDDDTIIYSNVSVYKDCEVGKNVIIHSGTVIGSDGFGFAPQPDGSYEKVPQIGKVIIEDWVEIGSNCSIDRATMGATLIKAGTKLDNLLQIAHNVEIGENTVIAAQTGISGSVKLGSNCVIGGQVGVAGHISLANGTKINAQSGVSKTIKKEGVAISGSPAFDFKSEVRSQVVFRQLPDMLARINNLEAQLKALEQKNN